MVYVAVFLALSISICQDVSAAFKRYLEVPNKIKVILDKHIDELIPLIDACEDHNCKSKERVAHFSWLPDYYIKYDVERRINGAVEIDACIKKYGLNRLVIPQKYIYRVKGRGREINNHNYLVVAPRVIGRERKPLAIKHVQQLIAVAKHTHFRDFGKNNLLFTRSDTLTFIDTGHDLEEEIGIHYLKAIERLVRDFKMEDDAFGYVMNDLKKSGKKISRKRVVYYLMLLPAIRA